jgi:type IV secretion system protein VirD4
MLKRCAQPGGSLLFRRWGSEMSKAEGRAVTASSVLTSDTVLFAVVMYMFVIAFEVAGLELAPWWTRFAVFGLFVGVPVLWVIMEFRRTRSERRRNLVQWVALTVVGWVEAIWLFADRLLPWIAGKHRLWSFALVDPVVYVAMGVGTALATGMIYISLQTEYDFTSLKVGDYGNSEWMPIEEVAKLFAPDKALKGKGSRITIGELYRPDLDKTNGTRGFDGGDKSTWGRGGSAPVATFNYDFGSGHSLWFCGSGGGKTTSVVVPGCLSFEGSLVVLDPAGEVADMVGPARRAMGDRTVVVLDPDQIDARDVQGFDVLAPLSQSRNMESDAIAFASLLCGGGGEKGNAEFFKNLTKSLITGLLLVLLKEPWVEDRTLRGLCKLTLLSDKELKAKLAKIVAETEDEFIKLTLSPFVGMADQTFSGVATGAAEDTRWLAVSQFGALVCGNTFDVTEIAKGKLDVFLSISAKVLKSNPGMARVMIGSLMEAMFQAGGNHERTVLFALDEVSMLGYMEQLVEAQVRGRKYGLSLMMIYQNDGQVEKDYGKEGFKGWLESSSLVSYAAISSQETAENVSKRCGERTVRTESHSQGASLLVGPFSQANAAKASVSYSMTKVPLILAQEILTMRGDEQIVFVKGRAPIRMGRSVMFRRPEMMAVLGKSKF